MLRRSHYPVATVQPFLSGFELGYLELNATLAHVIASTGEWGHSLLITFQADEHAHHSTRDMVLKVHLSFLLPATNLDRIFFGLAE